MQTWHLEQLKTESRLPAEAGIGLWLPSESCSIHLIDKPSAPRRKWPALLPWLVEERLLETPEKMHLTIVDAGEKQLQLLATSREVIEAALAFTDKVGVRVARLQPDFLALPWQEGEVTLAWRLSEAGRVLVVRTGKRLGFAASETLTAGLLHQLLNNGARARALMPEEALPGFLQNADVVCDEAPDWHGEPDQELNLLHGDFAPAKEQQEGGRAHWVAAALLVVAVALIYTWLGVSNSVLQERVAMLEDSRQQYFSQAFPGIRLQNDDVRATTEALLADRFLQRERLQEPLAATLMNLDPLLERCDCRLVGLNMGAESATLEFSGAVAASAFDGLSDMAASAMTDESGMTRIILRRTAP